MKLWQTTIVVAGLLANGMSVRGAATDILPTGGVNLGGYDYFDQGYPFVDFAKMSRQWLSTDGRVWSDERPIELTPTGYPASLVEGQIARTLVFTHNGGNYELGTYDVTWDGTGMVRMRSPNSAIEALASGPNDIQYNVNATTAQGLLLEVRETDPADPVRNIKVIPTQYKDQSSPFHPSYVADLKNYGVIRFMDWTPTNGNGIEDWVYRTTMDQAHWGGFQGIPYEMQIELGNQLQQDIWLTIPHAVPDDYITKLAQMVDAQLDPNLRVWIEYSNEVWNGSFAQNRYARDVLGEQYGTTFLAEAVAQKAGDVFDVVAQELDSDRFIRVLGGWAQTPFLLSKGLPTLQNEQGETNADVAAIAAYFSLDTDQMENLYNRYRVGRVDLDLVFDELREAIDVASITWKENAETASAYGLELVSYEGGQHIIPRDTTQRNDPGFIDVLKDIQRDPRMGDMYEYMTEKWREIGGTTLVLFNNMDPWTRSGTWGLKEGFNDDNAPKFDAIQAYLEANPGGWDLRTNTWLGDIDGNGVLDVADIDMLTAALAGGSLDEALDLNRDGLVNLDDHRFLIEGVMATSPGDANLDGVVSSADLVLVLVGGTFEDDIAGNSTWATGDWTGDQEFSTADLVALFQTGQFDSTAVAAQSVPEPSSMTLLVFAVGAAIYGRRRLRATR